MDEERRATSGPVTIFPIRSSPLPDLVLGIDPGLAATGWGLVRKNGLRPSLCGFGVITSPAQAPLPQRLRHLYRELSRLIARSRPAVLAIEELYFAKFATTIAATAQARGVALLAAAERGVAVVEYNPRAVKIAMTGYGAASKEQMQAMVQRFFRLVDPPRPDDAADALAIALCHLQTNHGLLAAKRADLSISPSPTWERGRGDVYEQKHKDPHPSSARPLPRRERQKPVELDR